MRLASRDLAGGRIPNVVVLPQAQKSARSTPCVGADGMDGNRRRDLARRSRGGLAVRRRAGGGGSGRTRSRAGSNRFVGWNYMGTKCYWATTRAGPRPRSAPASNSSPLASHVLPNSPINRPLQFRACNCTVWPTEQNFERTW